MLYLDLETRSQCNLITEGLMRYAQHPTTEIICMSYCFDDDDIVTWFPEDGTPFPVEVVEYIASGGVISAHNASFERAMFDFVIANDFGIHPPKLRQWHCTSAQAMAHGLPASLKDVCHALNIPLQKQSEGARLIRFYSAPNFYTEWHNNDKQLMQEYCEMDVATMRQFCSVLRELTDDEWEQYHITEEVNDRGVPVDIEFATAALNYSEEVKKDVDNNINRLTGGAVPNARARLKRDNWVLPKLTETQLKLITVKKDGKEKVSFDAEHRAALAAAPDLSDEVSSFIELLEEAGGSSVAKYKSMANTHVDGRVFGSLIWNGAGATGRYSSRGLQLQNFKRDVFDDPEPVIADIIGGYEIDSPAKSLGRLVRSAITSPQGLTFSDYSQIEARVLPWLADDPDAEKTLDIFRQGRDLYSENAIGMFSLRSLDEVTKDLRQSAKQGVLACGFGGGAGAVLAMAKGYGMALSYEEADLIKNRWRRANPWAERLWYGLKEAAQKAVRFAKTPITYKRITFMYDGADWLWMRLPSGRFLAYFQPRFEEVEYPWGDTGIELTCLWGSGRPKAGQKWLRRVLNHLILSENATQATAADIMRETIVRAHKDGLPILFSVHDELVVEGYCGDRLHAIMTTPPSWADGLPIDADTQENTRYGK